MSSTIQQFAANDTWRGGHYEIEFELGVPSDQRLSAALCAIWSHPSLTGCYLSREQELENQLRVDPRQHSAKPHLYGTATLPGGLTAACGTHICRLEEEDEQRQRDLLSFYVPLGALSYAHSVGGYPFSDSDRAAEWRPLLDGWLIDLGRHVFQRVPFQLALVGFEVDFPNVTAEAIQSKGIPAVRYDGFLWQVGNQLEWYPPTNFVLIRFNGSDGDRAGCRTLRF